MKRFSDKLSYASDYIRKTFVCFKLYLDKLRMFQTIFGLNEIGIKRYSTQTIFHSRMGLK